MKVGKRDDDKVIVIVKQSLRDAKGKIKYKTFESFDVLEATPEKVYKVAYDAIAKA